MEFPSQNSLDVEQPQDQLIIFCVFNERKLRSKSRPNYARECSPGLRLCTPGRPWEVYRSQGHCQGGQTSQVMLQKIQGPIKGELQHTTVQ